MIDLTIARCKVNATHKNKRFLFDEHDHERITNSIRACGGKKYFAPLFAASDTAEGTPCCRSTQSSIPVHGAGHRRECLDFADYAPQSSSASRFTAGAFGFLLLIQCGDRPEL
jgi:hypothetical protein